MTRSAFVLAALAAAAIAAGTAHDAARAHEAGQAAQEIVTPLLKSALAGSKDMEVNILHVSAPPGFSTVKHRHPGQLFLYVLEGAVTLEVDGRPPVKLGPGDVAQEPANSWMVGRNLSTTHGAKIIVFQIGKKGEPLQVDAK